MEKNYIKVQVYLMAIYDKKKLEKSIFYLLPKNSDFARYDMTFVLKYSLMPLISLMSGGNYIPTKNNSLG